MQLRFYKMETLLNSAFKVNVNVLRTVYAGYAVIRNTPSSERGGAIVDDVIHREVSGSSPSLIVLVST